MIELCSNRFRTKIAPAIGGSIAELELFNKSEWVHLMRPAPSGFARSSEANFVMAPYSNRIRDGRFSFHAKKYQLRFAEKHAIHGDVRDRNWKVRDVSSTTAVLDFDSAWYADINFPFPFRAELSYSLSGDSFTSRLVLTNPSDSSSTVGPFPVGGGFHPYFMRSLGAQEEEVQLQFRADKVFLYSGKIPLPEGEPVKVPDELDFVELRPLVEGLDHGYCEWDGKARLVWPKSEVTLELISSNTGHLIVYSPTGERFFAFEPAANCTDGFNLYSAGANFAGVKVLFPGQSLDIIYTLTARTN